MKNKKKEILEKIKPVFFKVFDNKNIKIDYDSSPETIARWDSLAQINLIVGIEKLMKIKFRNPKDKKIVEIIRKQLLFT